MHLRPWRRCHHGENGSFGHDYNNAPPLVWTLRRLFPGVKLNYLDSIIILVIRILIQIQIAWLKINDAFRGRGEWWLELMTGGTLAAASGTKYGHAFWFLISFVEKLRSMWHDKIGFTFIRNVLYTVILKFNASTVHLIPPIFLRSHFVEGFVNNPFYKRFDNFLSLWKIEKNFSQKEKFVNFFFL